MNSSVATEGLISVLLCLIVDTSVNKDDRRKGKAGIWTSLMFTTGKSFTTKGGGFNLTRTGFLGQIFN